MFSTAEDPVYYSIILFILIEMSFCIKTVIFPFVRKLIQTHLWVSEIKKIQCSKPSVWKIMGHPVFTLIMGHPVYTYTMGHPVYTYIMGHPV